MPLVCRSFLPFYGFWVASLEPGAFTMWIHETPAAFVIDAIAVLTVTIRQLPIPAINRAKTAVDRSLFKWLHGASVLMGLSLTEARSWLLTQLVQANGLRT